MTAYKFEIIVLDSEDVSPADVKALIESNRYLSVRTTNGKKKEIPEWNDDHILNKRSATKEQIDEFFKE